MKLRFSIVENRGNSGTAHLQVIDNQTEEVIYIGGAFRIDNLSYGNEADKECEDWLAKHYPDWKNPAAYWGDKCIVINVERCNYIEKILDIEFEDSTIGKTTLRKWWLEICYTLWFEEESFSGKRPLGNSGWKCSIADFLVRQCLISGRFYDASKKDLADWDRKEFDRIMLKEILPILMGAR